MQLVVGTALGFGLSAGSDLLEGDRTNLPVHAPALVALLVAMWALRRGRLGLASVVLLVTATAAISLLVWQNAGLRDPAMLAFPGILVFAGTMAGRRLFYAALAMILSVVVLVAVGNVQGWHVNEVPPHSLANLIDVCIVLLLTPESVTLFG
jgi:hypothetical protein